MANKKVLYTFYHGAAFGWIVVHRLTVHSDDEAYLLLADRPAWFSGGAIGRHQIEKFVQNGWFKDIYTYDADVGLDGEKLDCVEKVEQEIVHELDEILLKQKCDLKSFDAIYSHTDWLDTIGMYLAIKGIKYFWFESFPNGLLSYTEEKIIKGSDHKNRKGYREALLKYRTILGENKWETPLILANGNKSEEKFCCREYAIFNLEEAINKITESERNALLDAFEIDVDKFDNKNSAMIILQSSARGWWALQRHSILKKRYFVGDYVYLYIQVVMDYFTPKGAAPILKTHPMFPISDEKRKKYLLGVDVIPNLFNATLMHFVNADFKSRYIIESKSTANKELNSKSKKIACPCVVVFPVFYHKYFVMLICLSVMKKLYKSVVDNTEGLNGESEFNDELKYDLLSLIEVNNLKFDSENRERIFVFQECCEEEKIKKTIDKNNIVIHLDVWGILSRDVLARLCDEYNVAIIKIEKTLLKTKSDIIAPIEDEYIFIIAKEGDKVKVANNLVIVKNNPTIGIKLLCHSITLQQYLFDKEQQGKEEHLIRRLENNKKLIDEVTVSVKHLADVLDKDRVK